LLNWQAQTHWKLKLARVVLHDPAIGGTPSKLTSVAGTGCRSTGRS
jgi:hypothetical protein